MCIDWKFWITAAEKLQKQQESSEIAAPMKENKNFGRKSRKCHFCEYTGRVGQSGIHHYKVIKVAPFVASPYIVCVCPYDKLQIGNTD